MELWIHVDLKCMAPTASSLAQDIGRWADEGATGVVFEWENMFPYPDCAAVRAEAYTPGEVGALLDACRGRGLKAIPLVQTFGHVEWFLSHPRYVGLREFPDDPKQIRACDGRSWDAVRSWIGALLDAHRDSPYVHLGADEAWRLAQVDRLDCSAVREGPATVFLRHMRPFFDQVLAAGKRPIIWADMVLRHPDGIAQFPKEVVLCDWLYSQTAEHAAEVHTWSWGRVSAANYAQVPEAGRRLFEPYWNRGAADFPARFYQFPYTPFLRDHGFDVVVAPATLYAGNGFAGTNLPRARANARGWLNAASRHGVIGALNTCWAVRGALRETTRAGHRAFLTMGRAPERLPDREVSVACWRHVGAAAQAVSAAVDSLAPCVDPLSRTAPLEFDTATGTHRPKPYDQRYDACAQDLGKIEDGDPAVADHLAVRQRAAAAEAVLVPLAAGNEEARAWLLGAREAALRADLWLAVREKARTGRTTADIDALRRRLKDQAQAVRQFMMGRYQSSDVRVVGEDRFQSALRLVDRLAASQI